MGNGEYSGDAGKAGDDGSAALAEVDAEEREDERMDDDDLYLLARDDVRSCT